MEEIKYEFGRSLSVAIKLISKLIVVPWLKGFLHFIAKKHDALDSFYWQNIEQYPLTRQIVQVINTLIRKKVKSNRKENRDKDRVQ